MKKLLFIIFFLSVWVSQAQDDDYMVSYQQGNTCPSDFFLDNAVTATPCEEADLDGWTKHLETSNFTMELESIEVQDGLNSIKLTCSTDIVSSGAARLEFTGLTIGVTYNVTVWIKRSGSVNISTTLHASDGWVISDSNTTGVDADVWFQDTLTAEADATTGYLRLGGGTTWDIGEIIYGDKVTIQPAP